MSDRFSIRLGTLSVDSKFRCNVLSIVDVYIHEKLTLIFQLVTPTFDTLSSLDKATRKNMYLMYFPFFNLRWYQNFIILMIIHEKL